MSAKEKQATPQVAFVFLAPLTSKPPALAGRRALKARACESEKGINMNINEKKTELYRINKANIDEIMNRISALIRGRGYSYKENITDRSGKPDQKKLQAFIKELLDGWEEYLCSRTNADRNVKESPAADYIETRRQMYEKYLLCAVSAACAGGEDMRFEKLLNEAKALADDWCVMDGRDGRYNDFFYGIDHYEAFQYYERLAGHPLGAAGSCPYAALQFLTNFGRKRRMDIRAERSGSENNAAPEDYDIPEDGDDMDVTIRDFGITEEEWQAMDEYMAEEMQRQTEEETAVRCLPEGYAEACEAFFNLFRRADLSTVITFYEDMEQIVDLYLLSRDLTVLTDTDKCLHLYGAFYDHAFRQAKKYARGIEWDGGH